MLSAGNKINTTNQNKSNILETFNLEQAFRLAKKKYKEGMNEDAKQIYKDILRKFPKNKKAQHLLINFNKPSQETINQLITLFNQGKFLATVEKAQQEPHWP